MSAITNDVFAVPHSECVMSAFREMISSICDMAVVEAKAVVDESDGLLLAMISLVGDVAWTVFIGLPKATAGPLVEKFSGFELDYDDPDMADAGCEMGNVFGGLVKAHLDKIGVKVNISLPNIMKTQGMRIITPKGVQMLRKDLTFPLGDLWIGLLASGA